MGTKGHQLRLWQGTTQEVLEQGGQHPRTHLPGCQLESAHIVIRDRASQFVSQCIVNTFNDTLNCTQIETTV